MSIRFAVIKQHHARQRCPEKATFITTWLHTNAPWRRVIQKKNPSRGKMLSATCNSPLLHFPPGSAAADTLDHDLLSQLLLLG